MVASHQRGAKQSPFIGKRVQLVENGFPLLYPRYWSVEELLRNANVVEDRRTSEQQATQADNPSKTSKKRKSKDAGLALEDTEREALASGEIDRAEPNGAKDEKSAPISKKKSKKVADQTIEDVEADHDDKEQSVLPPKEANTEEAMRLRQVLGFTGEQGAVVKPKTPAASISKGTSFSFGFSVEEQEAARTEAKLQHILTLDAAKDGYISKRVYVCGLPHEWDRDTILEYWSECGEVEALDMMTFPTTGNFNGVAFITFKTDEAYETALACQGEMCEGRALKVERCKALPKKASALAGKATAGKGDGAMQKTPGYLVAYVGNISFEATPEALNELFEPYGGVKVRLHTDKHTGVSKGFAHVHFKSEEDLDRSMELDGHTFFGRKIKVGYAQPKK